MSELSDQIEADAAKPQRMTGDAGSVDKHPLPDLIEADRYLSEQTATNRSKLPIRLQRLKAGGAA